MNQTISLNIKENLEKYINRYFNEKFKTPYNFSYDVWKYMYELFDIKAGESIILSHNDQENKKNSFITTMLILREPNKDGMDYKVLLSANLDNSNQIVYGNRNRISMHVRDFILPKDISIKSEQDIGKIKVIEYRECFYIKLLNQTTSL